MKKKSKNNRNKTKTMKNKTVISPEITASVELITPAIAKKMLDGNLNNRKLRKFRVAQYADAMKRGMWDIQNDAITISKSGKLLNGQHRLTAIVEADQACQCLVLRGVDESTYSVIDSGLARTVNDSLHAAGLGLNSTHMSPMAKTLIAMDAGLSIYDTNALALVQRRDVVEYVENNGEILTWALHLARKVDQAVGGIRHAWGVFAILAAQKHGREKVEEFINMVVDGAGLKPGDSPLALRNWISRQRGSWHRAASKGNIAIFIIAFNRWLNNEKVAVIRPVGETWETFPQVID